MDWKLLIATVLFVFGLMGFSMYQSSTDVGPTANAVTGCIGESCDVVDLSLLEEGEEELLSTVDESLLLAPIEELDAEELSLDLEETEETDSSVEEETEETEETVVEVTSLENVAELTVNEGEKIVLNLDAVDPDGDQLYYTFSEPFDDDGIWNTKNGESGVYDVEVTVTDGEFVVAKQLSVLVFPVNFAPEIVSLSDTRSTITVAETEFIEIEAEGYDDDGDEISYSWILDEELVGEGPYLAYQTSFEDAGSKDLSLVLSDGEAEESFTWVVNVENTNRAPVLFTPEQVNVSETDTVRIEAESIDLDGDDVTISFSEPLNEDGRWETGYDDEGFYEAVVTASDGAESSSQLVGIVVVNTNREPTVSGLSSINVREGEVATIEFAVEDEDEDQVLVSFLAPFDEYGQWETTFEDAGDYTTLVSFTDGKSIVEKEVAVSVANVNRAPVLFELEDLQVTETDVVQIEALAADDDQDDVSITFSSPLNADGTWETDYDSEGTYTVTVTASDGVDETTTQFSLTVANKNRPPQILGVSN